MPDLTNNDEPESPRGKHLFSPRRGQRGARQRAGERAKSSPHEAEHTGAYKSQQTTTYELERTGGYKSEQIPGYELDQTPLHEGRQTGSVYRDSYRPTNGRRPGTMKPSGHESESSQEETNHKKDDSNQIPLKNRVSTREVKASIPGYSPYIADVTRDFSNELGDSAHEASNMKQALNLWHASGLPEQEFVEVMQKARKLTRRYQSRPTWDPMSNKMAYWFTTLRDLIAQSE